MHTSESVDLDRQIRVFICSTFRDMQAERDHLVKFVFPELRKRCETRGATWGEVDLRWGVTSEEAADGRVLPICLEEINRCRPYFIGLLGERYGWIPEAVDEALIAREPWLREHVGERRSVTELEILHGALEHPAMAARAFFYFRDPAAIDTVPTERRADFLSEDAAGAAKLAALKARIRASGLPVREGFISPEALGAQVLADLTAELDRRFPEGATPSPDEHETRAHLGFARQVATAFVGREDALAQLDGARTSGRPVIAIGDAGSGKSALLARWMLRVGAEPGSEVVYHSVGATASSADWRRLVRRVMAEINRRCGMATEIPETTPALRQAFADRLRAAVARTPLVLVIDGLDRLEDVEGGLDLEWLPRDVPEGVCLVLSSRPGRQASLAIARGWTALHASPLNPHERAALVREYLGHFGKRLPATLVERIVRSEPTGSPLFLCALLEEMRVFGVHEDLSARLDAYLAAPDAVALYERILARYEADYDRVKPGLVKHALSLLALARRGLSEAELREMTGHSESAVGRALTTTEYLERPSTDQLARADGGAARQGITAAQLAELGSASVTPLPHALWAPLRLAVDRAIVSHAGILRFSRDDLRQAVLCRYVPDAQAQKPYHELLALYFMTRPFGPRMLDELPWHLMEAGYWQTLIGMVSNPPMFSAAWSIDAFAVREWWARIEAETSYRMVETYRPLIAGIDRASDTSWFPMLASLLASSGHAREADAINQALMRRYDATGNAFELFAALSAHAHHVVRSGNAAIVVGLLQQMEALLPQMSGTRRQESEETVVHLRGQSFAKAGDLDQATGCFEQFRQMARARGATAREGIAVSGLAVLTFIRGDVEQALARHREAEGLYRAAGDQEALAGCLASQASVLMMSGRVDQARHLQRERAEIAMTRGDMPGLASALTDLGMGARLAGDPEEACAFLAEAEAIHRELGNRGEEASVVARRAELLGAQGQWPEALELCVAAERTQRELGDRVGLTLTLCGLASARIATGDPGGALAAADEGERLCRESGYMTAIGPLLEVKARILEHMGRPAEAAASRAELTALVGRMQSGLAAAQPGGDGPAPRTGPSFRRLHL